MRLYLPIENFELAFRVIEDLGLQGDDWDLENLRDAEVVYQGYRYRRMDEQHEYWALCRKSLRTIPLSSRQDRHG